MHQDFIALFTKYQDVGYCLRSLMLLMPTAVTIEMATPDKKIPKCSQRTFPEEKTMAAEPRYNII